ncbi:MAG: peptidylprolyl isomerase [Hydrogenoanaerobacterium sp.]
MTKKIIALLLTAVISVTAFTACSSGKKSYLTDENGNPVKVDTIVTIDGENVSLEELRYYILNSKDYYEQSFLQAGQDPAAFWTENPDMMDMIKEQSLQTMVFARAIKKYAGQHDIKLTAEEKRTVTNEIDNGIKENGSPSKYDAVLEKQFMTRGLYKALREDQLLQQKLQKVMLAPGSAIAPTAEEVKDYLIKNYLRAKHILISTQGITDEAELAAKTELAEKALARAKAGEDFDALIAEYGEDPGTSSNPDGYIFPEGQMVTEFYEGTKALKVGEISGIIKSDFGIHIINRLPLDDAYFEANKATLENMVCTELAGPKLDEELKALMDSLKVVKSPEYDKINSTNLK